MTFFIIAINAVNQAFWGAIYTLLAFLWFFKIILQTKATLFSLSPPSLALPFPPISSLGLHFHQSRIPGLRNQWYPVSHYLDSYIILSYFGFIYFFSYFGVIYFNLMTILPKKNTCNLQHAKDQWCDHSKHSKDWNKKGFCSIWPNPFNKFQKKEPKFTSLGIFLKNSKVKSAKTF